MSQPEKHPKVVLVDDGELSDVRRLLDSLQIDYCEADAASAVAGVDGCKLLISNARHALATPFGAGRATLCGFHVVVYDAISDGLRRLLSRSGCDVAVGRPVHPAVMRLIVAHAFYAGPERREAGRVAMSVPVRLVGGVGSSDATLIQLSQRGCGLIASIRAGVGDSLTVVLPPELTGTGPLSLPGSVIDARDVDTHAGSHLALTFDSVDPKVAQLLEAVMRRHSLGFTSSHRSPASDARRKSDARGDCRAEERQGPRKLFADRVVATGRRESRVMICRDLSLGGMRVRPIQGLQVGDEFKLALYDDEDSGAMVVGAVVARDDGWDGLVLRFHPMSPTIRRRLARLVESLPAARPASGSASRASGVLVSEILETG